MASGNLQFRNGSPNGNIYLSVDWRTQYQQDGQCAIHVEVWINANMVGYAQSGSHLTVNGYRVNFNGRYYDSSGASSATWVKLIEMDGTIWHSNWYQAQNVDISAMLGWNGYMWNGSTASISSISGSGTITVPWEGPSYVPPQPDPNPPTNVPLRVWNGSQWCDGIVQVWNGAQWLPGKVRVWNGAQWIDGS